MIYFLLELQFLLQYSTEDPAPSTCMRLYENCAEIAQTLNLGGTASLR